MNDEQNGQREFWGMNGNTEFRSPHCVVGDLLEPGDSACYDTSGGNHEVLVCGAVKSVQFMDDVGGLDLSNVVAQPSFMPVLPSFIPEFPLGNTKKIDGVKLPWVAVKLSKVVNPRTLKVRHDFRDSLGVDRSCKILLLNYGSDALIEKVWTHRRELIPEIASLGVDLVTGIDYSVFTNHPHMERLVNIKRGLFSFSLFQDEGVAAVPHLYWSGPKDIGRWVDWLKTNSNVTIIASYLGLSKSWHWDKTLREIDLLIKSLDRDVTLLASGPSTPRKIRQLRSIVPKLVITSSVPVQQSLNYNLLSSNPASPNKSVYPHVPIMENVAYFERLIGAKAHEDAPIKNLDRLSQADGVDPKLARLEGKLLSRFNNKLQYLEKRYD